MGRPTIPAWSIGAHPKASGGRSKFKVSSLTLRGLEGGDRAGGPGWRSRFLPDGDQSAGEESLLDQGVRTGPNKPDSVSGPLRGPDGDHSSHGKVSFAELGLATQCDETRSYITRTEVHAKPARRAVSPVLSCTARGFSCPVTRVTGGGLLPRLFTLTATTLRARRRFIFCDTFRQRELAPSTA